MAETLGFVMSAKVTEQIAQDGYQVIEKLIENKLEPIK